MIVSALTYRRVRPRLRVSLKWEQVGVTKPLAEIAAGDFQNGLHAHVKNLSPTEAKVLEVHVLSKHPLKRKHKTLLGRKRHVLPFSAEFIGADPDMDVPAFGGVRWEIGRPFITAVERQWVSVRVTLTNGDQVQGRWMPNRKLLEEDRKLAESLEEVHRLLPLASNNEVHVEPEIEPKSTA